MMSNIEQALKSAIEAMENADELDPIAYGVRCIRVINQCKSALAELEKCEPVYQAREINDYMWRDCNIGWFREYLKQPEYAVRVLYTSPQPQTVKDALEKAASICEGLISGHTFGSDKISVQNNAFEIAASKIRALIEKE